jgi:uncharacterized spore protein YtfJ
MADQAVKAGPPRLRVRTVRGEPVQVENVTLIPEARIVSFGRARATIGADRISGSGMGFSRITPVAVLVVAPEGEKRIAVVDATASIVWRLAGMAAAIVLFFAGIRWLARQR